VLKTALTVLPVITVELDLVSLLPALRDSTVLDVLRNTLSALLELIVLRRVPLKFHALLVSTVLEILIITV
jgi:hypothetical protein